MNRDLLKQLEIDENLGLRELVSALEAKQYEYLERMQGTDDISRQAELERILQEIDDEITQTKEEIRRAGSALIFDEGIPEAAEPAAPAEPAPDILEEKIESLRQQEEERAAEAKARAEAEAAAAAAAEQNTGSTDPAPTENQQNISDLAVAAAAFQRKDFATAFQYFSKLAEQDDANAQHFLSMMYHDGNGMPADWDGFDFWSKKAVQNGNPIAMEYRANMLLRDGNGKGDHAGKAAKQCYQEALDLLERAGGPENLAPLETFISIVELRSEKSIDPKLSAMRACIKSEHVKKAMDFCQVISDNIPDSYKKKQWLDRKTAIKKNKPYRTQGAVDTRNAGFGAQQQTYKPYRPKKRLGCGCWFLIILTAAILIELIPAALDYVKKAKSLNPVSGTEHVQEEAAAAVPYGTVKLALTDVPEQFCGEQQQITLQSDHDFTIADSLWSKPTVYRAGNGSDTAYADYIPDGKFSTLELETVPFPGYENFMTNTHVAFRIFDLDSNELLSENIIGSDPVPTAISADITGRRAIRIAVSLVDGGNGFANLGYMLVRNAYLIPAENAEAPAEGEAPPEGTPADEPLY